MPAKQHQEHPLTNILVNVLLPVTILSFLSTDPNLQEKLGKSAKLWHLGPVPAISIALALPLAYGIWFYLKTRQMNFFSGLGLASVALTGALTLYLWNPDGTVKPNAGLLFGLKEGSIPLALGVAVLLSNRTDNPLIRAMLFNDSIFDIPKIEARITELSARPAYDRLLRNASWLFAASFFISSLMNLALAQWFFAGFDAAAADALEKYNSIVARITGWGFAVIGVPILLFLFFTLMRLLAGLRKLTGFSDQDLLLPR